jgi:hypothetical protein
MLKVPVWVEAFKGRHTGLGDRVVKALLLSHQDKEKSGINWEKGLRIILRMAQKMCVY